MATVIRYWSTDSTCSTTDRYVEVRFEWVAVDRSEELQEAARLALEETPQTEEPVEDDEPPPESLWETPGSIYKRLHRLRARQRGPPEKVAGWRGFGPLWTGPRWSAQPSTES